MMRLAWGLDVKGIKNWTEQVAALSREGQIRFLQKAQRLIRENFILRLRNRDLTYMNSAEMAFAAKFAQFIHEKNVVQIMEELALAEAQIAQNGNTKIILFHLYLSSTKKYFCFFVQGWNLAPTFQYAFEERTSDARPYKFK